MFYHHFSLVQQRLWCFSSPPTPILMGWASVDSKSWYLLPSSGHLGEQHAGFPMKSISKFLSLFRLNNCSWMMKCPIWRLYGKRHIGQPLSILIFPWRPLKLCHIPFKAFCVSILLVNSSEMTTVHPLFLLPPPLSTKCVLCVHSPKNNHWVTSQGTLIISSRFPPFSNTCLFYALIQTYGMSNEASVGSWLETEVLLWWAVADIRGWLRLKSITATRGQQRPLSVCQETGRWNSFQFLMVPACRTIYHVITVFHQLLSWTLAILNIDVDLFI